MHTVEPWYNVLRSDTERSFSPFDIEARQERAIEVYFSWRARVKTQTGKKSNFQTINTPRKRHKEKYKNITDTQFLIIPK